MAEALEGFRSAPALAGLSDEELQRLADAASEVEYPAGHVLIEYDTPAAGLYLILDGRVGVHAPEGDRECGPGDVVGERALAAHATRSARVSALTPVRCLSVAREHVDPELAEKLRGS
jgi:CRP-like cAMP-binding protein